VRDQTTTPLLGQRFLEWNMLSGANHTTLTQTLSGNNHLWVAGENKFPSLQVPYGFNSGGFQG